MIRINIHEAKAHLSRYLSNLATTLPSLHRDPFDRMLTCRAMVHGLTLVAPDKVIAQYRARILW